jgi:diguanylate cyclase (GGDEF)-like protein
MPNGVAPGACVSAPLRLVNLRLVAHRYEVADIADAQATPVPLALLSSMLGPHRRIAEMKMSGNRALFERAWNCGCAAAHLADEADVARWRPCAEHVDIFFIHHRARADVPKPARRVPPRKVPNTITPLLLFALTLGGLGISSLVKRVRKAESEALIDGLTGLYNRRGWDRRAFEEGKRLQRLSGTMTAFVMDVDDLKVINDRDGHAAGDAALQLVASVIRSATRDHDVAARIGGDEFALLGIDAGIGNADVIAVRLADGFAAAGLSVSIGRAEVTPESGIVGAVERADRALYCQKERRKNAGGAVGEFRLREA